MLSIIAFVVVLGVLVLVHELGHFAMAKRCGVRIEKFSIGFGPKIFSVKKGETEYLVCAIPLGGYVKMAGDEPGEAIKNEPWEFLSKSVFDRFKIVAAGPVLNYVLAFVIFSVIFMFGSPTLTTEVGSIMKGYPAENSGLSVGDRIIAVNGIPVKYWEDMTELIHKQTDGLITLKIQKSGSLSDMVVKPKVRETKDIFGNTVKIALIGIQPSQKIENVRYPFFQAAVMGFKKLVQLTYITYKALWYIVIGRMSVKESMTGPIGIFLITGQAAKLGFVYILHLMGILSASLAIFNLLPLPVLDGGHIFFLVIEKIRKKPLSLKTQEAIANAGVALLVLLTIFVFYNDMIKFGIIDNVVKFFKR